jgi:hypothetical protein
MKEGVDEIGASEADLDPSSDQAETKTNSY